LAKKNFKRLECGENQKLKVKKSGTEVKIHRSYSIKGKIKTPLSGSQMTKKFDVGDGGPRKGTGGQAEVKPLQALTSSKNALRLNGNSNRKPRERIRKRCARRKHKKKQQRSIMRRDIKKPTQRFRLRCSSKSVKGTCAGKKYGVIGKRTGWYPPKNKKKSKSKTKKTEGRKRKGGGERRGGRKRKNKKRGWPCIGGSRNVLAWKDSSRSCRPECWSLQQGNCANGGRRKGGKVQPEKTTVMRRAKTFTYLKTWRKRGERGGGEKHLRHQRSRQPGRTEERGESQQTARYAA